MFEWKFQGNFQHLNMQYIFLVLNETTDGIVLCFTVMVVLIEKYENALKCSML